ncbi:MULTISPECIES: hypothetical protein [unclassified Actinopolyspora]|uniref:hypothetical protein n=1 Tax=unclassified Actinopolyspora TaxID=2639451 RepID=UPI0013F5F125|nr:MULTISPECIES: hypothetical protein [unclassified Actinopolyspora]NHD16506.1 hypothetical protein [Actinopolyspora sp. BKK2]NHE75631.1 hypothetical protein [Actinopolyspora sp. BKK1]
MLKKVVLGLTIGWAGLLVLLFAVMYGYGTLNSTYMTLVEHGHDQVTEEFTWENGDIGIEKASREHTMAYCHVVPANGEERNLQSPTRRSDYYRHYERWFSGPATMTCDQKVRVRTGTALQVYGLASSRLFQIGLAVAAAVPLALALNWVFGLVRIRRR